MNRKIYAAARALRENGMLKYVWTTREKGYCRHEAYAFRLLLTCMQEVDRLKYQPKTFGGHELKLFLFSFFMVCLHTFI